MVTPPPSPSTDPDPRLFPKNSKAVQAFSLSGLRENSLKEPSALCFLAGRWVGAGAQGLFCSKYLEVFQTLGCGGKASRHYVAGVRLYFLWPRPSQLRQVRHGQAAYRVGRCFPLGPCEVLGCRQNISGSVPGKP